MEFNVFSLGNGRVLKRPTSRRRKRVVLRREYPSKTAEEIEGLVRYFEKGREYSRGNLKRHVLRMAPELLGNPIFLGERGYTQDKALVLGKYLKSHTLEENKLILQAYVRCILRQWRLGFFHIVCNFATNYGVDRRGRVILLDLGELTFSKAVVAYRIKKKLWLKNDSYLACKDERLKRYYAELMDRRLTLEALRRLWKKEIEGRSYRLVKRQSVLP